ncbi:MAG: bifunctional phosphopantothenoylcysteine decarboxylase/phosphopantothenate--cysteine ligase CoaBC [Mariprofundaceae bacterium]|nr:bifunctional phosphopantothenoylcysteine decarboxylase/phosphopantothenate--cysteine ligase CoaBC [Mariprofundaceae bacterium]
MLNNKKILIGIGGGIAVYRVAELVRLLQKQGALVRCVMTKSAMEFVQPLTFEALTSEKVHTELFDLTSEREMGHIQLARWADLLVVAPATANLMAKLAYGIADDLLTTLYQAGPKKTLLAPAMNPEMWASEATVRNRKLLKHCCFIGPISGVVACGEKGVGRLAEPEQIMHAIYSAVYALTQGSHLAGQHWVINAGATHEYWDSIRFISNPASGKTGFALAACAAARGAKVSLIAGPNTPTLTPYRVQRYDVVSANDMLHASHSLAKNADAFVASAAVGDFSFKEPLKHKFKRGQQKTINVTLQNNPDIVKHIAQMTQRPKAVIAFAAETEKHIEYATKKMLSKKVDAIYANDVSNMASDQSAGFWLQGQQCSEVPVMDKWQLASWLVDAIMRLKKNEKE